MPRLSWSAQVQNRRWIGLVGTPAGLRRDRPALPAPSAVASWPRWSAPGFSSSPPCDPAPWPAKPLSGSKSRRWPSCPRRSGTGAAGREAGVGARCPPGPGRRAGGGLAADFRRDRRASLPLRRVGLTPGSWRRLWRREGEDHAPAHDQHDQDDEHDQYDDGYHRRPDNHDGRGQAHDHNLHAGLGPRSRWWGGALQRRHLQLFRQPPGRMCEPRRSGRARRRIAAGARPGRHVAARHRHRGHCRGPQGSSGRHRGPPAHLVRSRQSPRAGDPPAGRSDQPGARCVQHPVPGSTEPDRASPGGDPDDRGVQHPGPQPGGARRHPCPRREAGPGQGVLVGVAGTRRCQPTWKAPVSR